MNRSLKIIQEIPANKAGIKLFADAIVDGLMSGDVSPLEVRARIDAIEKIIKSVKANEQFRDVVLDEADLHPDKTFVVNGINFTKANSVKYDYTNDPTWIGLKHDETVAADKRKEHEAIVKALPVSAEINGVMCHPPVKSTSTGIRVTF